MTRAADARTAASMSSKQFHHASSRRHRRLYDEDVSSPRIPVDAHEDLPVGEVTNRGRLGVFSQDPSDLQSQRTIRSSGNKEKWSSPKGVVHEPQSRVETPYGNSYGS